MSRLYIAVIHKRYLGAVLLLGFCLVILAVYGWYPLALYTAALLPQNVIYDVMLDPGHGGIDSGAIGAGDIYEKNYMLDIVLMMHDILTKHDLNVGLTRDSDRDVSHLVENGTRHRRDLLGRFQLMNNARVGMSVHANAAKDSKEQGAIVFYMKDSYIDKLYAQITFEELEKVQIMNHDYIVPRNNLMLPKAKPPVLLVEVGFMTNQGDLEKLGQTEFRQNIAEALSTAILKFLETQESEQSES